MTVDEMTVDEMTVDKMTVDEMTVDEMTVDEMTVDEMTVDEMTVDKMTVDEMIVDEFSLHPINGSDSKLKQLRVQYLQIMPVSETNGFRHPVIAKSKPVINFLNFHHV
jgi:pentapeptide MXKDX repeat protein